MRRGTSGCGDPAYGNCIWELRVKQRASEREGVNAALQSGARHRETTDVSKDHPKVVARLYAHTVAFKKLAQNSHPAAFVNGPKALSIGKKQ